MKYLKITLQFVCFCFTFYCILAFGFFFAVFFKEYITSLFAFCGFVILGAFIFVNLLFLIIGKERYDWLTFRKIN